MEVVMGDEHGELAVEMKPLPEIDSKSPRTADPAAPEEGRDV